MKKLLVLALLTVLLTACFGAQAEFNSDDFGEVFGEDAFEALDDFEDAEYFEGDEGFELSFDDGGYTGEWTSVDALRIEFFLPEGWKSGETAEDEYFFAENEDGTAELGIVVYDDGYDGSELSEWAAANLEGEDYAVGMANTQEVVLLKDGEIGRVMVLVPNADGNVIGFNFYRTTEDVLSDEFAVEIAGTCTDLWN